MAGRPGQRFDTVGALILLATLAAYALGMTLGQNEGFTSLRVLGLLGAALVGLVIFILVELRAAAADGRTEHVPQHADQLQPADGLSWSSSSSRARSSCPSSCKM